MEQRIVIRYSGSFKREVVESLESGRFSSIYEATEHYGIGGAHTIKRWLKTYGRNSLCPKVVRVEKADEQDQIRLLKKEIRQLKEALGQTQAEKVVGEEFLKLACERMGMDAESFKKKVGGSLFMGPGSQAE